MTEALQLVARLCVPTFIVSSMLAMGLALTPRAILAPLRSPRLVVAALAANFVIAPGVAWLLAMPLERPYAVGLILIGCAAGAPFLPKVAAAAGADAALSASLMALLGLGTLVFMPFALPLLIPGFQASPLAIARPLLLMMALPVAVGMAARAAWPGAAGRCRPAFAALGSASLALLLVLMIGLNFRALIGVTGSGALAMSLVLAASAFAAGYLLGGPGPSERGGLGLASAARNVGAALPAASAERDPKVVVMLLVATIASLIVSFGAAAFIRRRSRAAIAAHGPAVALEQGGT